MRPELIVIGASAGGLNALRIVLGEIPKNFPVPIIVVLHISPQADDFWIQNMNKKCQLNVKEAEDKEQIQSGTIYFAPANYHVLIDEHRTIALSVDEKVNYSRPSIDVLFESAADVYKEKTLGVILTGSSNDGSNGLKKIKEKGGITVAQDPTEAEYKLMPEKAIQTSKIDHILPLEEISKLLLSYYFKK